LAAVVLLVGFAILVVVPLAQGGTAGRQREQGSASTTSRRQATAPSGTAPAASTVPVPGLPAGVVQLVIAEPSHASAYDRDLFVHWSDADRDCQSTRAEVLIAESRVPVTFTTVSACTVATGDWLSPWSGVTTKTASALDVDHTVPLANAWRSGAWAWTAEQRQAFANDIDDADHLIALPASENRSKSDGGPEEWRPPNPASWCRYAQVWTQIKARWSLTASPAEWSAVLELAAAC
jgi:hypothetical protein